MLTVRTTTAADHPAIRRVVRAAFSPYAGRMDPRVFRPYLADLLDLDRHAAHGQLLVADVDGRVSGFGAFYPDIGVQDLGWPPGWAGGRALAVDPRARRHGVARAMLAACEARARALDAPVFAFHTISFMTTAVALYEGLGYRRAPDYDVDLNGHYGVPDAAPLRAIAYRRDLLPRHPEEDPMTRTSTRTGTSRSTRRATVPAYYLGRPAAFWVDRLGRAPAPAAGPDSTPT
jgi:GNAT superfamily N-acetyltransferase